jgi:hypothetical protein
MENMDESKLNSEMIWKMQKKRKLNSEKIWKLWKKNKLKCEMVWKIWRKSKLNSEKIWKMRKMYYCYSNEKAWENDVTSGHVTSNDVISGDE